jgi:hypothetical protein
MNVVAGALSLLRFTIPLPFQGIDLTADASFPIA